MKDVLPGHCPPHQTPFQVEDFEGCDVAIIQHTHFDHDLSAGDLYRRFHCDFLVHEAVAYEFGKCFDIPYAKIIPYATEGEYRFQDFTWNIKETHPQLIFPTHYEGELMRGIDMEAQMNRFSEKMVKKNRLTEKRKFV